MRRGLRIVGFFVFVASCVLVGVLAWDAGLHPAADGAPGVICGPGGEPIPAGTPAPGDDAPRAMTPLAFFTGGGEYMPRVHCLVNEAGTTDWPWVWTLLGLNAIVIAGYARIFVFWRRAYLDERPEDRNRKLMQLAWIFLLCAACGYAASIVMFIWPAYRLVAFMLIPLALFTWKFCANLDEMRVSLSAKRLERELREAMRARTEELESEVAARTAELREARDAAEAADAAKSAFVATVSHEIRTPLNAIMGYSSLLADPSLDDGTREEYAGIVRRNGEHLATVIDDVLDLSKIESGNLSVERVACDPAQIVNDVVQLMKPRAEERGITLEGGIEGTIAGRVTGDPTRIRQVLLNLVSNAVKFTEQGSVRVRAHSVDRGANCELVFEVIDTGIGLTPEQCVTIFQPFRQAEPGTTRRYGGTGLGLTISRSLCELMGGSLTVESTKGHGSTFTATMVVPVLENAGRAGTLRTPGTDRAKDTPPADLRGRVLIADDSVDNRRLFRAFLARMGVECAEAEDGLAAIRAVESAHANDEPFGLVLMDIDMPHCDGETAMKRIRTRHPDDVIVALTAHTMSGVRERLLAAGFDDYASKPMSKADLGRLCEKWLAGGRRDAA